MKVVPGNQIMVRSEEGDGHVVYHHIDLADFDFSVERFQDILGR
jgi:hypothetical protein